MEVFDLNSLKFNLDEINLMGDKRNETKLGFAILYKFFQIKHRFPQYKSDIPDDIINLIGKQIGVDSSLFEKYSWDSRSITYHRKQIRELFGFREYTITDSEGMKKWLIGTILQINDDIIYLKEEFYKKLYQLKIEPTSDENIERIISSALNTYENDIFENVFNKLSVETIQKFDLFLAAESENNKSEQTIWLNDFSIDPDGANIESVFNEANKLRIIEDSMIPVAIFEDIPSKYLDKYYKRSKSENISELKRHPDIIRNVLLAIFFHFKSMEIKDNLVDLLIKIMNHLDTNANRKVKKELAESMNYTRDKNKLLLKIAKAVVDNPEAKTRDIIYPIADEQKLKNLIDELENKSVVVLNRKNYNSMKSSYQRHYRRILPDIISALNFNSNNDKFKPIIEAIEIINKYLNSKSRYYSKNEIVPIDGVVKLMWKDMIEDKADKNKVTKIKRVDYELCALQSLKDKLRCREVWINGADKYRNPDEDLPKDFDLRKDEYYSAINQPLNVDDFIEKIRSSMKDSLSKLNKTIPKNEKVKILNSKSLARFKFIRYLQRS